LLVHFLLSFIDAVMKTSKGTCNAYRYHLSLFNV